MDEVISQETLRLAKWSAVLDVVCLGVTWILGYPPKQMALGLLFGTLFLLLNFQLIGISVKRAELFLVFTNELFVHFFVFFIKRKCCKIVGMSIHIKMQFPHCKLHGIKPLKNNSSCHLLPLPRNGLLRTGKSVPQRRAVISSKVVKSV